MGDDYGIVIVGFRRDLAISKRNEELLKLFNFKFSTGESLDRPEGSVFFLLGEEIEDDVVL